MTDSYKRITRHFAKQRKVIRQQAESNESQEQLVIAYEQLSTEERYDYHPLHSLSSRFFEPDIESCFSSILGTSDEAKKRRARLLVEANILDENGCYVERFFSEETLRNDKNRHKRT